MNDFEHCQTYAKDIDVRQTRIRVNHGEISIVNGLKGGLLVQIIDGTW